MQGIPQGMFDQLTKARYSVVKVSWDDTGRAKFSVAGPNMVDQTLLVNGELMSIVRGSGDFEDVTCDVPIDKFKLRVGNETGTALTATPLTDVLKEKGWFLPRDTHLLTSTQLCLLPLGKEGFTEFALRLFNYQSTETESALAVIVASSQGSSVTAILRPRDRQIVFFNDNGTARPFEARRLKADRAERKVADTGLLLSKDEKDRNQLFVFHVPLKVARTRSGAAAFADAFYSEFCDDKPESCMLEFAVNKSAKKKGSPFITMNAAAAAVVPTTINYELYESMSCDEEPVFVTPGISEHFCSSTTPTQDGAEMSTFDAEDGDEEDDVEECECEDHAHDMDVTDVVPETAMTRGRGPVKSAVVVPPPGPKFDAAMLRVSTRDCGKFHGLEAGKKYERDPTLPIRCVIQTYAAIGPDDKELSPEAMLYIAEQLLNPYRQADAKGSLVTGTGTENRVTAVSATVPLPAASTELPSMMQ